MSKELIVNNQYNIGHICTRQQCNAGGADKPAMRFISPEREGSDFSFGDVEAESNRFANVLASLGFVAGDVLFTFLPKQPEQFFAFLGALKAQVITGTLFANFGEEAILDRLGDARVKGVITRKSFLKKIAQVRDRLPDLKYIFVVDGDVQPAAGGILSYPLLMAGASREYDAALTGSAARSVLHYTSGWTGKSQGV